MISKETLDKIFEAIRVEEIVGEFVTLKKRGVNLLGLCPFHNEKTPSFTVSPAKGIYKCFGCGKAGNAISFVMEHEHYSYPETLKYLAKKYSIEIEEDGLAEVHTNDDRESLYIVSAFAQKFFNEILFNHSEGRAIGLSYFKERGFSEEIIQKFQLGYSLDSWNALTEEALKNAYKIEYLEKTGLVVSGEEKIYDRFRGRVIFPIHSLSGRVIAFGARALKSDSKTPKYINSPETDIYHKSKILYGIHFAKKSIIQKDNCYLVEGYTDVISLHQAGIENIVASSGTSLTQEQIKLIGRYTNNITILYDGDTAGIKASLRGIDLVLQEGMNVKIVLFPEGEDPDSFSKKLSNAELVNYIERNKKDFIVFKTDLLIKDVQGDPIKRVELLKDIVETISKIPDTIAWNTYVKKCSELMEIGEQVLISELNKIRRRSLQKKANEVLEVEDKHSSELNETLKAISSETSENQEREIIRILLNYKNELLSFPGDSNDQEPVQTNVSVAEFLVHELKLDGIEMENQLYKKIFDEFEKKINENASMPDDSFFVNHQDEAIRNLAIDLLTSNYELSENWEKNHGIYVPNELSLLKQAVLGAVYSLKLKKLLKIINETQAKLKQNNSEEEYSLLIQNNMQLLKIKKELAKIKGTVIIK